MHAEKIHIGWREWVALPRLAIPGIKAKIDTGARTSALHTFMIEPFEQSGIAMVRFGVHPLQKRRDVVLIGSARISDRRVVTDSGGHRERRYVIETELQLGERSWPIEITLTNRDKMRFRMLLGRTALSANCLIEPGRSYLTGRRLSKTYFAKPTSSHRKGKRSVCT